MTNHPALLAALSGQRRVVSGSSGPLSFYARGAGRPLLLVHSINAAASAFEMRPIYERIDGHRVFAPDLPGFGFSDRSARDYSIGLYTDALLDMLDAIFGECGTEPVDVVALSLTSEFLARAALRRPHRIRRIVMITPTGFARGSERWQGPSGSSRQIPGLLSFVSLPLVGTSLFSALTTRASIRYFLRRTWGSREIDEELCAYCHLTAHQPGAHHAPLAFVSGKLFGADVRRLYEAQSHHIWMPHATRGDFADFSDAGWIDGRDNWRRTPYPAGAMLHFEQSERFMSELLAFLDAP